MIIEYHVHLEEGPYSAYWISQTVNALEFFMKEKPILISGCDHYWQNIKSR